MTAATLNQCDPMLRVKVAQDCSEVAKVDDCGQKVPSAISIYPILAKSKETPTPKVPNRSQKLPKRSQKMPKQSQKLPKGSQKMPKHSKKLPKGSQSGFCLKIDDFDTSLESCQIFWRLCKRIFSQQSLKISQSCHIV